MGLQPRGPLFHTAIDPDITARRHKRSDAIQRRKKHTIPDRNSRRRVVYLRVSAAISGSPELRGLTGRVSRAADRQTRTPVLVYRAACFRQRSRAEGGEEGGGRRAEGGGRRAEGGGPRADGGKRGGGRRAEGAESTTPQLYWPVYDQKRQQTHTPLVESGRLQHEAGPQCPARVELCSMAHLRSSRVCVSRTGSDLELQERMVMNAARVA